MPEVNIAERITQAERELWDDPEFVNAKLDLLQGFLHEATTRQVTIWWHELDLLIRLARKANYEMAVKRTNASTPTTEGPR